MITLKLVLRLFSKISGLHINFEKSSFCPINLNPYKIWMVRTVMGCAQAEMPISYLGMPLSIKRPRRQDFLLLIEKIENKIEGWLGKLLSKGGRLQLINSVLCSVPIYLMTYFALPKWVIQRIERLCRQFLWGKSHGEGKGIPLIKWEIVSTPKQFGGLGVPDLELRNCTLLMRWSFHIDHYILYLFRVR